MKKLIYLVSATVLIAAGGCKKDFLDINRSPNSPTEASITPNLILPRVQHATGSIMSTSYGFLARWMGYWARSGTYGPSTEEESYNITTTFNPGQWTGWYDILNDVNIMEKKANAAGQGFYEGIAKVMKTIGFMHLVDMYNNVPYSKAFDLSGNITPAYDKGQDIYNDLLRQLDQAQELFKNAQIGNNPGIEEADVIFHGDATMWRKLANTQRLKLLIRQSQVPGFSPTAEIAKITADGSGFLGSGQTASVQPGYTQDLNKQNPFWNTFEKLYTGDVADQYNRANNIILDTMKSTNDIRYQYFFDPAVSPQSPANPYIGYNYGEVIANAPVASQGSGVGGPALARSASQEQWIFTSVESMFLQAEAVQRGWLAGTAKTAYENAVRESFIWLGVSNAVATANTYLAQPNPNINWDAATDKIRLIITQKHRALVGINNFEPWVDYRRTGFPNVRLSLSPSRGSNVIPLRLRYPQNEYNYNAANVGAEGNPDPQTSGVFWDR
jgi:hypothetical protein